MRPILLTILKTAVLAGLTAAVVAQSIGVAARVNGKAISYERLQKSVDVYVQRENIGLGNMFNPDDYKEVRRRVLDSLIGQELLWQEAEAKHLVVSQDRVDEALERMRGQFQSERMFLSKIEEGGFNEKTFAEDLERRLSVQRLIAEDIAAGLSVSDGEVHEFYEANRVRFTHPPAVRARHILIEVSPKADQEAQAAARGKIEGILAEAHAGADFAELARQHSEGPSASKGGDLGFFAKDQMVKPFASAAFALEPGQISEPVRTRFGYHIIKLEERRDGGQIPKAQASGRIRAHLLGIKRDQAMQTRVRRLREAAVIEILTPL
jgi:peptidyl-prolyl cis-trans isomerase C